MTVFEDYEAWKSENYQLISQLVRIKSNTIARFSPVIAVVDYLNDESNKRELNEDEYLIFTTGFDYIYDQFHLISALYEMKFNSDIDKMEKCSKAINLLLYINDFKIETLSHKELKKDINKLEDLENRVSLLIDNEKDADDELFYLLDLITHEIFEMNDIEIQTIDQIFYEIAIEFSIYPDDDFDIFNFIVNEQIKKSRKAS